MKHAESYVVKLPIGSPSLKFGILLSQKRDILRADDVVGAVAGKLNFTHKLF